MPGGAAMPTGAWKSPTWTSSGEAAAAGAPGEQHGQRREQATHQWSATVPSSGSMGSPSPVHAVMPPSME